MAIRLLSRWRNGRFKLALSDVVSSLPANVPLRPVTSNRIQLCVNVESVDQTVKALGSIGAKVMMEPNDQPWGERAAYVEDPDGNLVLIVAPLATSRPRCADRLADFRTIRRAVAPENRSGRSCPVLACFGTSRSLDLHSEQLCLWTCIRSRASFLCT